MTHLPVNPGVLGSLRVAGLTLLLWGLGFPAHAHAQAPTATDGKAGVVRDEKGTAHQNQADLSTKNVLILHAFEANLPINVKTDQGLLATLEAEGLGVKQQFFEYLDLGRNPGPEHRQHLAELLRMRYGQRKIDLIITLYTVSSAPPGTIVFFVALVADISGKTYTPRDVVQRLSQASTAPVFGLYDTLLGCGIAGGSLTSFERTGAQAGRLALEILVDPQSLQTKAAVLDVPAVPMFDWRQLRR